MAVAVLLGALIQAADRYKFQPDQAWLHHPPVLILSVALPGALVLINTVGDVLQQKRALRGESKRLNIHKPALATLVAVSADTSVAITDLGINVFLVREHFSLSVPIVKASFRIGSVPRLERVERIRLSDHPAASNITWTPGKGVIGDCWKNARPEHVHWAPLAKRWHGKDLTDAQWAAVTEKDRSGFSKDEFVTMVGKYAEIQAVPIKDGDGKVLGVVALDRAWRVNGKQEKLLASDTVEESLTATAVVLHNVLTQR